MAKKQIVEETCSDCVVNDPVSESPLKHLSEFVVEKKGERVNEEMLTNVLDLTMDVEVIVTGFNPISGGSSQFYEIGIQGSSPENRRYAITNSPAVIKKLAKVKQFPVLAKFVKRTVRDKFKYDIQ